MSKLLPVVRVLLLLVALGTGLALALQPPTVLDAERMTSTIDTDHTVNNARAEGAPQQQVVNGWTTHEYLALLAVQNEQAAANLQRLQVLLALLVATVAIDGLLRLPAERRPEVGAATADSMAPGPAGQNVAAGGGDGSAAAGWASLAGAAGAPSAPAANERQVP